jgi:6-pyruvoyltetrahydropterin/6-carboxytetrahydropterin synthase
MVVDFAELRRDVRSVLQRYDHGNWNDVLEYPTVENICQRLADDLKAKLPFPFTLRVYEGADKWAEV